MTNACEFLKTEGTSLRIACDWEQPCTAVLLGPNTGIRMLRFIRGGIHDFPGWTQTGNVHAGCETSGHNIELVVEFGCGKDREWRVGTSDDTATTRRDVGTRIPTRGSASTAPKTRNATVDEHTLLSEDPPRHDGCSHRCPCVTWMQER